MKKGKLHKLRHHPFFEKGGSLRCWSFLRGSKYKLHFQTTNTREKRWVSPQKKSRFWVPLKKRRKSSVWHVFIISANMHGSKTFTTPPQVFKNKKDSIQANKSNPFFLNSPKAMGGGGGEKKKKKKKSRPPPRP